MRDIIIGIMPYRKSASGIATYTLELSKSLASKGIHVCLIGYDTKHLNLKNIEIIDIGKDPTIFDYLGGPIVTCEIISKKLQKVLENIDNQIDIDIFHFPLPSMAINIKKDNIITVAWNQLTFRDILLKTPKFFKFPLNMMAPVGFSEYCIGDNLGYKKSKKIFCVSSGALQNIKYKYSERAIYMPPGICVNNIISRIKNENCNILFATRDLDLPKKNLILLLEITKRLSQKNIKNFEITLIGKYSYNTIKLIKNLVDKTSIPIKLVPYVKHSDMINFYSKADIFICPSLYEEFGYVVLEAMSNGLPVIASDISSFRDIVLNEENGFLISVKDKEKWEQSLNILINDSCLRVKMGQKSYDIVKKKFDWNILIEKYISEYEKILE